MAPPTPARPVLRYRIRNAFRAGGERVVPLPVSPEDLDALVRDGFLVRPGLFSPAAVQELRAAVDELVQQEHPGAPERLTEGQRRDGIYLRHLMDKHPAFLALFRHEPTLTVARAVLGPQVQVLPLTARVSYPGADHAGTAWHFHQRLIPDPLPPFFCRPHVLDSLIYLDDADETSGALAVVPGSHQWTERDLADHRGEEPGQVLLTLRAGDVVQIHGALWHRALPTRPGTALRRLLILPYAAAWLKLPSYGARPAHGLLRTLREGADAETLELLGDPEGLY